MINVSEYLRAQNIFDVNLYAKEPLQVYLRRLFLFFEKFN